MTDSTRHITLRAWRPQDRELLGQLLGDPAMTEHLGGPETPAQLDARHLRYLSTDGVFAVEADGVSAGWVGYWPADWHGEQVWECGWSVLPAFQGRGVATAAMALAIGRMRAGGVTGPLHAFPSVDNAASNAVCRKLGFTLLGEAAIEYPPGRLMRGNNWVLALESPG